MLKLLLSHMRNGIFFFLFQSLGSFVVPLSYFAYFASFLYPPLFSVNMKQFREGLFSIYYLYPCLHRSSPLTSTCQSPVLPATLFSTSSIRLSLFLFPFHFSVHLFPSPHLFSSCFLSSSSFRQVIGALYLGCYSNLNWLAVNFRPPIAKWLIPPSLTLTLAVIHSCLITAQAGISLILIQQWHLFFMNKNTSITTKQRAHIIYV